MDVHHPALCGLQPQPDQQSIIATALVPIAAELHVSVGATAVLVSSLYLASAVAQPTAGKLAEVLGPRRIFLYGVVLVLLGGLVGGLGQNLAMLTVARVLVGIGTSAAFPCAMVLIRRRAEGAGLDAPPAGCSAASRSRAWPQPPSARRSADCWWAPRAGAGPS
ncbi:MFS transporter [Streptomyces sp. LN500]|uniref:MFS transporter n=1 Tax=Streptomyces sp. LN500 TaxID=3112978 RepID=UPI003714A935